MAKRELPEQPPGFLEIQSKYECNDISRRTMVARKVQIHVESKDLDALRHASYSEA